MKIDAHQHFWRFDPVDYPWINEGVPVLMRDYQPEDLEPELRRSGFDGCIAVQAREKIEESFSLLSLADRHPFIHGVVGWVDLQAESISRDLSTVAKHPKFVGVRAVLQDKADDQLMLRRDFMRGIAALQDFDLAYDLLIFPKHLKPAAELVRRFPNQRFVLDHIAKPQIHDEDRSQWRDDLRSLSQAPNVYCKLSGLVTEAKARAWRQEDFTPYLDDVWEAFGPDRLMFGSDWPVALLAGSYVEVVGIIQHYLATKSESDQRKVWGDNAARFYRLNP